MGQESVGSDAVEVSLLWSFAHGADSKHGFPNVHLWGRKPGGRGAPGPGVSGHRYLGAGCWSSCYCSYRVVRLKEQNHLLRESDFALIFPRLLKLIKRY